MTKSTFEQIRLGLAFFAFLHIVVLIFAYINKIESGLISFFSETLTIPAFLLAVIIPVSLLIDIVRKKVIDRSFFNLNLMISTLTLVLIFFANNCLK